MRYLHIINRVANLVAEEIQIYSLKGWQPFAFVLEYPLFLGAGLLKIIMRP